MDEGKSEFIYPTASYRGEWSPESAVFNANLQEFAQRVAIICNLQTSGKITAKDAYIQIKSLWKQLAISKQELHIDQQWKKEQ